MSAISIPSIDRLLATNQAMRLVEQYGRGLVVEQLRKAAADIRRRMLQAQMRQAQAAEQANAPHGQEPGDTRQRDIPQSDIPQSDIEQSDIGQSDIGQSDIGQSDIGQSVIAGAADELAAMMTPSLKRVFNLTGTVLHTNLGRAPMPEVALDAMREAAGAVNVEMTLANGKRGDRDDHLEPWLTRLTGAEAATVVNNNAAAVLLTLSALASRREVPVSRGELVEIGGAFRIPDIMSRAGCKLVEVGTTNRTHLRDFESAISSRTALLMKVHTSNYVVQGFTASVNTSVLAATAHEHGLPLVEDLGSGSLVNLEAFGLPHEPTAAESIAAGVDVVTFSGDKLLGGPQCGIIVGRADLIAKIKKNPLKRALRVDKVTIAALAALLPLHARPETLAEFVPSLRLLSRDRASIRGAAERLAPSITKWAAGRAEVTVIDCESQVGSGAMPLHRLDSAAVQITPNGPKRQRGKTLRTLAGALRSGAVPIVCRTQDDSLLLDFRCIEPSHEAELVSVIASLSE